MTCCNKHRWLRYIHNILAWQTTTTLSTTKKWFLKPYDSNSVSLLIFDPCWLGAGASSRSGQSQIAGGHPLPSVPVFLCLIFDSEICRRLQKRRLCVFGSSKQTCMALQEKSTLSHCDRRKHNQHSIQAFQKNLLVHVCRVSIRCRHCLELSFWRCALLPLDTCSNRHSNV